MTSLLSLAVAVFVAVNVVTVTRFWQDKQRAVNCERRVPERQLLRLALIGGSPAALLARKLFNHKTRKQPFTSRLYGIIAFQAVAIVSLGIALR